MRTRISSLLIASALFAPVLAQAALTPPTAVPPTPPPTAPLTPAPLPNGKRIAPPVATSSAEVPAVVFSEQSIVPPAKGGSTLLVTLAIIVMALCIIGVGWFVWRKEMSGKQGNGANTGAF